MLPLLLLLQSTDKLPPANPLPPPASEEAQVMVPVLALLAAIERSDGAAVLAAVDPDGGATAALEAADGRQAVRRVAWPVFAAGLKPDGNSYREQLSDPAVEIDGTIAMVWSRYTWLTNGKIDHCGIDHFDLVRENGRWKVLNLTWSKRMTGCDQP